MQTGRLNAAFLVVGLSWAMLGMGEEHFGNTPLVAQNYTDWPGIVALINDTHRVYYSWVNGNEHFYFWGDAAAANEALSGFAALQLKSHEVVLRPGPGLGTAFDPNHNIGFDWVLHIQGGISKGLTKLDLGDKVWSADPTMIVYISDDLPLDVQNESAWAEKWLSADFGKTV